MCRVFELIDSEIVSLLQMLGRILGRNAGRRTTRYGGEELALLRPFNAILYHDYNIRSDQATCHV